MRVGIASLLFCVAGCFPVSSGSKAPGGGGAAAGQPAVKRPFVVNWAPTERTALETQAHDGVVVLAWNRETGEADVLGRCRVASETALEYRFVGSSHAQQTMKTTTAVDLGAHFPFSGPINLGAKLEQFGEINVEYHTIGEYKLDVDAIQADDLEGSCAGASHVVVALSVGAFRLFAGKATSASVQADVPMAAGAGGGASKTSEGLDQGGDPAKCSDATRSAEEPIDGCDSILAIELLPIEHDSPFVAGERWEGNYECSKRKATSTITIDDVQENGGVRVIVEFDYADVKGSFVAEGQADLDSGALTLKFVEWKDKPGSYVPVTFAGTVDVDKGEFSGEVEEKECGAFSYVRR